MNPADVNSNNNQPVQPTSAPTPTSVPNQTSASAESASPVNPAAASVMPDMPTPVNPVFNPGAVGVPNVAPGMIEPEPTAASAPMMSATEPIADATLTTPAGQVAPSAPINPALQAAMGIEPNPGSMGAASVPNPADVMVGATDPITMPNPPKAPDPIEEELKAPMTAAAPVPGSIGSAISVPAEGAMPPATEAAPQTPNNVAFNDPATVAAPTAPIESAKGLSGKTNKKTLIALCVVAGVVVVILVILLIMVLNGAI